MNKKIVSLLLSDYVNDSRVKKISQSLSKSGYCVSIVAMLSDGLKEIEKEGQVNVYRIFLRSRKFSKVKLVQLIKYFEFMFKFAIRFRKTDVIHCNDLASLPIGVLVKFITLNKVKLVYDSHEFAINDKPNERKASIFFKYCIETVLIRCVDTVIVVSESIADEYSRIHKICKPNIILNTPNFKIKPKQSNVLRERFNIDSDKVICICQGALIKGRGIELALDTFARFEDELNGFVLIFMGFGELEGLITQKSEKHANIFFQPAVPYESIYEYTSSADIGFSLIEPISKSYRLALPNKLFEYSVSKLKLLVSNIVEQKKIVQEYNLGLVLDENNEQCLKDTLLKLQKIKVDDVDFRNLAESYSWNKQQEKLIEIYRKIGL
ncbi:MAG: hypothetical protein CME62_08770 [Halobacteriovoraceae bacterium]|nr:hypothetical protein [Halobacteriovoraceae bacterium]|tara:strand:+ start:1833 stop:2972 length:1140 start_codon:yes stop_codon:yes gene_type:complete